MADPKVVGDDDGSDGPSLSAAVQHHQEGRLAKAGDSYQRILDAHPDQPDALHFLGVLRHQQRRSEEGLALIRRAISLRSTHPDMHNNLGNLLRGLRRPEEAVAVRCGSVRGRTSPP